MFFGRPFRIFRTASFALALLYAALFAGSAVVLGCIVYWTVQNSVDRQLTARIEGELQLLEVVLQTDGSAELVRQVQQRVVYAGNLEYFLANADGKRLAGISGVCSGDCGPRRHRSNCRVGNGNRHS